jgi:hypothetical protein
LVETLRLEKKDFVERDEYLCYDSDLKSDGRIEIAENLGLVKFKFGISAKTSLIIGAGSGIQAGWGIQAGRGIEAGRGIQAGRGIEAGWGIKAGWGIEAGWGIQAVWGIEAGRGIQAGWGIEAGEGIQAGSGIKAGEGIICLRSGLRATFVSCLRIVVGFNLTRKETIEAEIKKGDVILGEVNKPNPLENYGWGIHVHHTGPLFEKLTEPIENRIKFIKENKDQSEIPIRLKLFRKVKDEKTLFAAMELSPSEAHKVLDELHKKECEPDCPWLQGQNTIFPEKVK